MSFPRPRLVRLLPGILAPLLVCSAARAQIHEEKPPPPLEEGILLDVDASKLSVGTAKLQLNKPVGVGDFSVVIKAEIREARTAPSVLLYADHGTDAGWYVRLTAEGAVEFSGIKPGTHEKIGFATPAHAVHPNNRVTIVAAIKRDARQPLAGVWIDGVEIASGAVAPVDCTPSGSFVNADIEGVKSLHVRIYSRALTRPEILELQLSSSRREEAQTSGSAASSTPNARKSVPPHVGSYEFPKPRHPAPPPNGPRFIPQPDETIALIGGTEAVALAESGELEALLLLAFPETRFHFRSLAWEGDTVFKQDRPMNFGALEQQLRRVNAGAVFVMFGRQECLDAQATGNRQEARGLPEFKAAFETLLATVEKVTPNIVVIGPVPFEKKPPPLTDLSGQNKDLALYSRAMADSAASLQGPFCNVHSAADATGVDGLTSDGVSLTTRGCVWATVAMARQLALPAGSLFSGASGAVAQPGGLLQTTETLRKPIQLKNRLWHDYWRPSNWAFLHGDRTNQPSSRDPVNPQIRFFPAEQEKYLPLIKDAENKVFQLVQEAQKKLP